MKNYNIIKNLFFIVALLCVVSLSGVNVNAVNGATGIAVNTPVTGSVSQTTKSNWYSFSTDTRGYFTISFKSTDVTKNTKCYVKLYNSDRDLMFNTGSVNSCESNKVSCKNGEIFYIEVAVDWTYYGDYELCVNQIADAKWEIESNDTTSKATPLNAKTQLTGTICNSSQTKDVDVYKIVLKKNSRINVVFGPKDVTRVGELVAHLVNSSGEEVYIANNSKIINKKTFDLKKGTYYIRVKSGWDGGYVPYTVKYTTSKLSTAKKPTIKSASISANWLGGRYLKEIQLKKNVKKVNTYEVKVSTKKSMKKPILTTTAEAAKTITKFSTTALSNQKNFYIQIRPCVVDAFGKKIYIGKKSNVVKAKIIR